MTSNQKTTVNVVFGAMVSKIVAIDSLRDGEEINTIITNHLSPPKKYRHSANPEPNNLASTTSRQPKPS